MYCIAEIYKKPLNTGEHDKFSFELGDGMDIRGLQLSTGTEISLVDEHDHVILSRANIGAVPSLGSPNRNMFYFHIEPRNGQLTGVIKNVTAQNLLASIYIYYLQK